MHNSTKMMAMALALLHPAAMAEEVVERVTRQEVVAAFERIGLRDITDKTVDPAFPSIAGVRADGFTIQATFYACDAQGCAGLSLTAPLPARTMAFAAAVRGGVERGHLALDAWIDQKTTVVVIESYLVYDGGVSDQLLPKTVSHLNSIIDQAKAAMLKDDPGVVEVWPTDAQ